MSDNDGDASVSRLVRFQFRAAPRGSDHCTWLRAPAQAEPTRQRFLAARDAFRAGDAARLDRVAPRLNGHLLEQYVSYWQIRLKLDDADPARVRAFLASYDGQPLADRLRGEWLKSLGKREQWALFAAEYPKRAGDDTDLDCYAIQWRRARDGDAVLEEARPYWASGQDQPESCQVLFAALLKAQRLTPREIWTRFRLAHEAGNFRLAGRVIAELPAADRPQPGDLARIERNPRMRWPRAISVSARPRARTCALRSRSHRPYRRCGRAQRARRDRLPGPDRGYGNALVAYYAARQLNPAANDWYRDAEGAPQNAEQRAWRVRAALRARAWADVAAAIDAMPADQAQDPAWRYWKARALAANGQDDDATRLRQPRDRKHFYGLLAAEALGADHAGQRPLAADPAALAEFGARDAGGAWSGCPRSTFAPKRCANGCMWCAATATKRCCSRPSSHGAPACTTGRSTVPIARSAPRLRAALSNTVPRRDRRRCARGRLDEAWVFDSRGRRAASSRTSCPRRARSA
jgi:hypothetical protein